MYDAKEGGKRRFSVFAPAMRDSIVRRHGLKAELEHAIEQRELVVQYQPIVDLTTGKTVSVEALVRWNHPGRGRIPPLEFIPLAEETGLIVPLGRYVLEEACARVSERHPDLQVQVNLSAIELEHPDLLDTIAGVIQRTGIAPGRLVLEVTETLLVKDAVRGAETLQQLRDIGVQLALDDFGTGYSSLSYLRNLPLDSLKIAREFVEGLAFSDHDAAFVRLIVGLAKTVGLKVVAEGIETRAQLDMLREIGCDLGQGYYFAAADGRRRGLGRPGSLRRHQPRRRFLARAVEDEQLRLPDSSNRRRTGPNGQITASARSSRPSRPRARSSTWRPRGLEELDAGEVDDERAARCCGSRRRSPLRALGWRRCRSRRAGRRRARRAARRHRR